VPGAGHCRRYPQCSGTRLPLAAKFKRRLRNVAHRGRYCCEIPSHEESKSRFSPISWRTGIAGSVLRLITLFALRPAGGKAVYWSRYQKLEIIDEGENQ